MRGSRRKLADPVAFAKPVQEITVLDGLFTARPLLHRIEARQAYALVVLAHPHVTTQQYARASRGMPCACCK